MKGKRLHEGEDFEKSRATMKVLDNIHMAPSARWSRVYVIEGETLTLVDSGLPWNPRGIMRYIRSIGRRPEEVGQILVTHSHPDHVGGTASLARETGATVFAHRADTRRRSNNSLKLGYTGLFGKMDSPHPLLGAVGVDALVSDGDVLPIHGGIRVIHTPGHTGGSLCFLMEESRALFSGDTIFSDGRRISRSAPFPGYDRDGYVRSLERLAGIGFEAVCGGHGEPLPRGGAAALRDLLERNPEPPTWGDFFRSVPARLRNSRAMRGEHV